MGEGGGREASGRNYAFLVSSLVRSFSLEQCEDFGFILPNRSEDAR